MATELLSRTQVDNAGEALRKGAATARTRVDQREDLFPQDPIIGEEVQAIAEAMWTAARFRMGHFAAMSETFMGLGPIAQSHDGIAGFRHKRLEAIIDKLRRLPGRLSQMEDIAGCRVVVPGLQEVQKVRDEIERSFTVKAVKDYIENPKPIGYRSLHLIAEIADSNSVMRPEATATPVEIQVRTQFQSEWADTIERLTDRTGYDLKGGNPAQIPSDLFEYVSVAAELRWLADSGQSRDTHLEARLIELRNQMKHDQG